MFIYKWYQYIEWQKYGEIETLGAYFYPILYLVTSLNGESI